MTATGLPDRICPEHSDHRWQECAPWRLRCAWCGERVVMSQEWRDAHPEDHPRTTIRSNPVRFFLYPRSLITILWSGEPRTVTVDTENGSLMLRDLTDEESAELEAEAAEEGSTP